jgi:prefoldin subunit 5
MNPLSAYKNAAELIIGLLIFIVPIGYHYWKVNSLESKLESIQTKYDELSTANDERNKAVELLGKAHAEYSSVVNTAVEENNKNQKMWAKLVKDIGVGVIPKECNDAMQYLKNNLKSHAQLQGK